MNKYGTYVRGKLSKIGLTVGDYDIMKNPFEHVFVFEEGKGNVSVDSAYSILPLKARADLKWYLDNCYTVEPQSCHRTACLVGKTLEKYRQKYGDKVDNGIVEITARSISQEDDTLEIE